LDNKRHISIIFFDINDTNWYHIYIQMKKIIEKSIGVYLNGLAYINPSLAAKKGFNLFCNPMAQALKPYQISFLEKGKHDIIIHEDTKIQTYKWGNGSKKVLLIHGWASNTFRWKATIEHLSENDFTIYAFDAPAHGLSSGKILHVILYSKIIDLFLKKNEEIGHIISHSIGGFATVYWLFQNQENNIKKVILMGVPGEASDFFDFYKKILGLTDRTLKILTSEFVKILGHDPSYFSASTFAKKVKTQSLIIHDKGDKDTSHENSIKLHANWKNSRLLLTDGLGHSLKSNALLQDIVQYISM
jgi:pimeloyl-ACP methyl ester carboxylesterase